MVVNFLSQNQMLNEKHRKQEQEQLSRKPKKGARFVLSGRPPRSYVNHPDKPKSAPRIQNPPRIRSSVVPGRVCIVLAGKNAGRRVVVLKTLKSGLVVITGPKIINTVPMRRVSPAYLIATSIKVDLGQAKAKEVLQKNQDIINDSLFAKAKGRLKEAKERQKKEEKKPDAEKKEESKEERKLKVVLKHPREARIDKRAQKKLRARKSTEKKLKTLSETAKKRKQIQYEIDKLLKKEIKKTPYLTDYLSAQFSLENGQYPHKLKF